MVVSNFAAQNHLEPSRSNEVVGGYETWKQLPMMVSGTVRLPPPLTVPLLVRSPASAKDLNFFVASVGHTIEAMMLRKATMIDTSTI